VGPSNSLWVFGPEAGNNDGLALRQGPFAISYVRLNDPAAQLRPRFCWWLLPPVATFKTGGLLHPHGPTRQNPLSRGVVRLLAED